MKDNFVIKTAIDGLYVIERPTFFDDRGFFREAVRILDIEETIGVKFKIKQWSHSYSKPNVVRALHSEDHNKLIYPITGKMFSAYVDTRTASKTFGKIVTMDFSEDKLKAVFVPRGVANSICVNGDKPVHYMYLIDAYYEKSKIKGIAWNDPDLNIKWPVKNPIISDRDKNNPTMRELFPNKFT